MTLTQSPPTAPAVAVIAAGGRGTAPPCCVCDQAIAAEIVATIVGPRTDVRLLALHRPCAVILTAALLARVVELDR
jgi:hypothetical protein